MGGGWKDRTGYDHHVVLSIDGQVCVVRLQTDNFRHQTDKRQISVRTMRNGGKLTKENRPGFVFRFRLNRQHINMNINIDININMDVNININL
jgi:hypothetical protein